VLELQELGPALRAARYYRPSQLVAFGIDQAARRLERLAPRGPHWLSERGVGGKSVDRVFLAAWGAQNTCSKLAPLWCPERHGDPRLGVYRFDGLERSGWGVGDWDASGLPELWRYQLHYFDTPAAGIAMHGIAPWAGWLTARLSSHWETQQVGRGVAWKPYPLAVRLLNLLRTWALAEASPDPAPSSLLFELERHCRAATYHLAWRLEHQLGANHLLRELCAVLLGARVFEIQPLVAVARARLKREVGRQFGSGGGHEERSPSYHLEAVRDLSEVQLAFGEEAPSVLQSTVQRGLEFAAVIEHPDGDVPLFNDSQLDKTPRRALLSSIAGHRPVREEGLWNFEEEGYVVVRLGEGHLVIDCGAFGAPHQPAHSHCGALSFEYSWRGARRIVNRGTMAYGEGAARRATRGTAFHTTVQFGELEQAELWRGFRLGRRSVPVLESVRRLDRSAEVVASFRWPGQNAPLHRRKFVLHSDGLLDIDDEVLDVPPEIVPCARFFAPQGVEVELRSEGADQVEEELLCYRSIGNSFPARCVTVRPEVVSGGRWRTRINPNPGQT